MSKILVFSDCHQNDWAVNKLAESFDNYDKIVFCGDGLKAVEDYIYAYPDKFIAVSGNCDWYFDFPDKAVFWLDGVKFMVTHGHRFYVKRSKDYLAMEGMRENANCVLYGHTHTPAVDYVGGVTLFNGGSLGEGLTDRATFGEIEIINENIFPKFCKLSK